MRKINHSQLKDVVKVCYTRKIPLMVHGTMGIGKSQSIKNVALEIANENGLEFCENEADGNKSFSFMDVRISQLEPSDLRGLPSVENNVTRWLPPSWLPSHAKSKGILFFDELNLAAPSIQAAAYQIILDRRLGDYQLPDGWIIISAGNTSEDKANIFELPAPLANRFVHVELAIPTKEEWAGWALSNGIDGRVLSFLEFKPSYLYTFNKKSREKSFSTPRTWEYVSRLISGFKGSLEEIEILTASAVGEAIATEFTAFLRLQKTINLDDILKKPTSVKSIKSLDLKYGLMGGLVEKYREDSSALPQIFEVGLNLEPEFAILLLRYLKGTRATFVRDAIKLPQWKEIFNQYGKYVVEAR